MMNYPDFRQREPLLNHIQQTMAFYYPRCVDTTGGMYHFLKDNGDIYDASTRHLVSSTRYVFTFAMAYSQFKKPEYLEMTKHAVSFLRSAHRNAETEGYAWEVCWKDGTATVLDETNHCYGLAFVLLAYAHALMAGIPEARSWLDETYALMEKRFWEPTYGLYADEATGDWQLKPYRGQNANMHACEAMLTAFEATGDTKYLHRAEELAKNITIRQAALANNMMWEHYQANWQVDWEYNKDDKTNIFRPWGYQPGHLTEWAKLLLIMERFKDHLQGDSEWLLPKAITLFDTAMDKAWDREHGGLFYGFGPEDEICDSDKYFWVQAESLATAALLANRTGNEKYWAWYNQLWIYSWDHMIDHQHGAWYRILSADNKKYSDEKSPAGKVDYHTMGACYEALNVLG
ncbi:AGE family epimerase/isomerase [Leeia sp. TBRC 13508]|uniref:AGE family epimerase/isomerase n=1 Tax=Leeia speluncae TaxID=2884804 RepID=A0ABS8DAR6_9NEIS|nr:AGE family epimerase/isomerase [Leeia speluncae]MCB6185303.1 AGE family epimerase/isomerase [Leeia speluncae]